MTHGGDRPHDPRVEVRWMFDGPMPGPACADAAELPDIEDRVDHYAPPPHPALGVKGRGGDGVDVKVRLGDPIPVALDGVSGLAERWVRYELDTDPRCMDDSWTRIAKHRRQRHTDLSGGPAVVEDPRRAGRGSSVEITRLEVGPRRRPAWTVAVEAWGGDELAAIRDETRTGLHRTAATGLLHQISCVSYPARLQRL